MQKSSIGAKIALAMGAIAGIGVFESPFRAMPAKRYDRSYKMATPRPENNPAAGSKLARKAAERRLTGNRMSHYGQGLLNAFAAKRGVRA